MRIKESPTDPKYPNYEHHDTVLIHLDDGTALRVQGSSYEEVSQSWDEIGAAEVLAYQRAAQGRREAERLARLKREEFAALPKEEREAREAARRAKLSPFALAMEDTMKSMVRDMISGSNKLLFGSEIVIPVKKTKARRS